MKYMKKKPIIAVIAHDGKKAEMVAFIKDYINFFKNMKLVATGTTGIHIQKAGLEVDKKLSGPEGGDAQIAAMVAQNEILAVIFFRDPLGKHPHEPDIQMLLRICDHHNIPLATNLTSAKLLLKALQEN